MGSQQTHSSMLWQVEPQIPAVGLAPHAVNHGKHSGHHVSTRADPSLRHRRRFPAARPGQPAVRRRSRRTPGATAHRPRRRRCSPTSGRFSPGSTRRSRPSCTPTSPIPSAAGSRPDGTREDITSHGQRSSGLPPSTMPKECWTNATTSPSPKPPPPWSSTLTGAACAWLTWLAPCSTAPSIHPVASRGRFPAPHTAPDARGQSVHACYPGLWMRLPIHRKEQRHVPTHQQWPVGRGDDRFTSRRGYPCLRVGDNRRPRGDDRYCLDAGQTHKDQASAVHLPP